MRIVRRRTIGIDPGTSDAGGVLLEEDGRTVLAWFASWSDRAGDVRFVTDSDRTVRSVREVGLVADRFASETWGLSGGLDGIAIAVEGLEVFAGKRNHHSMLSLAYAAGTLAAPFLPFAVATLRPTESRWRSSILSIPKGTSAAAAEAVAVSRAEALFDWPKGWPGKLRKDARGALAEAACIARYGVLFGGEVSS